MGDAAPEFGERAFGSLPSTFGQTAGEHGRIDRPCTRRADAFECNAFVLEEAVEDTPGEGAVRSAPLQGEIDELDLDPPGQCPKATRLRPYRCAAVHHVFSSSRRLPARKSGLSFTKKCTERD
jgi:hypothetical protein